jgi:hypothetical protein
MAHRHGRWGGGRRSPSTAFNVSRCLSLRLVRGCLHWSRRSKLSRRVSRGSCCSEIRLPLRCGRNRSRCLDESSWCPVAHRSRTGHHRSAERIHCVRFGVRRDRCWRCYWIGLGPQRCRHGRRGLVGHRRRRSYGDGRGRGNRCSRRRGSHGAGRRWRHADHRGLHYGLSRHAGPLSDRGRCSWCSRRLRAGRRSGRCPRTRHRRRRVDHQHGPFELRRCGPFQVKAAFLACRCTVFILRAAVRAKHSTYLRWRPPDSTGPWRRVHTLRPQSQERRTHKSRSQRAWNRWTQQ